MRVLWLSVAVALSLGTISVSLAATKPTPVPGGANQAKGVAGGLKDTLFNGQVRVRKMALTKPKGAPDETYTDDDTNRWIVYRALMSNGTSKVLDMQQFSATIADADGIVVAAQPDKLRPMGSVNNIPPGGAWQESIFFQVPKAFKPVKIVLVPTGSKFQAFRITLAAGDIPG